MPKGTTLVLLFFNELRNNEVSPDSEHQNGILEFIQTAFFPAGSVIPFAI